MNSDTQHETNHVLLDAVDAKRKTFKERVEAECEHDHQRLAAVSRVDINITLLGFEVSFAVLVLHFFDGVVLAIQLGHGVVHSFLAIGMRVVVVVVFMVLRVVQVRDVVGVGADELLKGEDQEVPSESYL